MALPDGVRAVTGAQQLHDWFGYWPTFHDADHQPAFEWQKPSVQVTLGR